ncbi:MAG: hypothetical protein CMJ89_16715 [Planctomycetes bacterium]|nr:hypothetical protein [Planctomycetota bacterium]
MALGAGCSPSEDAPPAEPPRDPPTALYGTVKELRAARDAKRHTSDGGGRAWLEQAEETPIHAGQSGRWEIVYEVGPEGIEEGGFLRLTIPAFWEWTPAQTVDENLPGYTTASIGTEDVVLRGIDNPGSWVDFKVEGRKLTEGERITIVYGDGNRGARADRYAEAGSRFWISVDGDGDGIARILPDSPEVEVLAGPPARLNVVVPSTVLPDEAFLLRISVLDAIGNAGTDFTGEVRLIAAPDGLEFPETVSLEADDLGVLPVNVTAREKGLYRFIAQATVHGRELVAQSNPLLVEPRIARIMWADLHGHSNLSDGTGTPEQFLRYARDVSGLDVVALTDHDHWGMLFLDEHPDLWEEIRQQTRAFNDPGNFVTVLGYEWTSWIHGHRHVLYFGDDGPIISSIDERYETPTQLWEALRRLDIEALTFAHHSAGGPIATNWKFAPDPQFEPVTEIASVHGSSEASDSPQRIYNPLAGNFVRDVLDQGYRLGFIGSGDSHDGHPGLAHLTSPYMGGLAALITPDHSRQGVREALLARRCYATNGPRIILRTAIDGNRMGSTIAAPAEDAFLYVRTIACAPIVRVELIRSGAVVDSLDGQKYWDYEAEFTLKNLAKGEYVYVRVIQEDGGAAWSSPFYVD